MLVSLPSLVLTVTSTQQLQSPMSLVQKGSGSHGVQGSAGAQPPHTL